MFEPALFGPANAAIFSFSRTQNLRGLGLRAERVMVPLMRRIVIPAGGGDVMQVNKGATGVACNRVRSDARHGSPRARSGIRAREIGSG